MSILTEADELINGDRAAAYGDARHNLTRVSNLWRTYMLGKYGVMIDLMPEDVCWMMVLLKMSRQMHQESRENVVDAAGYVGLVEKVTG